MGETFAYKEYLAGLLAGVATVITGHPFDTVKVSASQVPIYQFSVFWFKTCLKWNFMMWAIITFVALDLEFVGMLKGVVNMGLSVDGYWSVLMSFCVVLTMVCYWIVCVFVFIRWCYRNIIQKHMGLSTRMVCIARLGYYRLKEYAFLTFSCEAQN